MALRKKGIPEVLVRSVMCLYEGAKTRVRVDSDSLVWLCVEEGGWSCVEKGGWLCVEKVGWSCIEEGG